MANLNHGFHHDSCMGLPLAKGKPVKQPAKLARGDRHNLFIAGRPLKRAMFQTTVKKPEAVDLPKEELELVTLAIAKHEQARREWIQAITFLDESSESID
nr:MULTISPECIES: hypothetical protein [unclassified Paenibacillus]